MIKMFDKDVLTDDFMGEADLSLISFTPNEENIVSLELQDGGDAYLMKKIRRGKKIGSIRISFKFSYSSAHTVEERLLRRSKLQPVSSSSSANSSVKIKVPRKTGKGEKEKSRVHVLIVSGRNLAAADWNNNSSDPCCKMILGKEKHKTSTKQKTTNPTWNESFSFTWNESSSSILTVLVMSGMNKRNEHSTIKLYRKRRVSW